MNKKRILTAIMVFGVVVSVGMIAAAIINGKYLEAIAITGVVSTFAWFLVQGKEMYQRKIVEREEQVVVRER